MGLHARIQQHCSAAWYKLVYCRARCSGVLPSADSNCNQVMAMTPYIADMPWRLKAVEVLSTQCKEGFGLV